MTFFLLCYYCICISMCLRLFALLASLLSLYTYTYNFVLVVIIISIVVYFYCVCVCLCCYHHSYRYIFLLCMRMFVLLSSLVSLYIPIVRICLRLFVSLSSLLSSCSSSHSLSEIGSNTFFDFCTQIDPTKSEGRVLCVS